MKKQQLKFRKKKWKDTFQETVISTLNPKVQKVVLKDKQKQGTKSIYLFGGVGTGKTVTAAQLYLQQVKDIYLKGTYFPSITYEFIYFSDLFHIIKKAFTSKDGSDIELIERCRHCDVLVLDDVGVKTISDWALDIIYLIIDFRYRNEKNTIITSNLTIEQLASNINDDRILRRIEDEYIILEKQHWNKPKKK